jgi:hypothetical protein
MFHGSAPVAYASGSLAVVIRCHSCSKKHQIVKDRGADLPSRPRLSKPLPSFHLRGGTAGDQLAPSFGWESMILGIPGWLSKGAFGKSKTRCE